LNDELLNKIVDKFVDSHSFTQMVKAAIAYIELQLACQKHLELMIKKYKGENVNLESSKATLAKKKEEFGIQLIAAMQLLLTEMQNNPHEQKILESLNEIISGFNVDAEGAFDSVDYANQLWNKVAAPLLDAFFNTTDLFASKGYEKSPSDQIKAAHKLV